MCPSLKKIKKDFSVTCWEKDSFYTWTVKRKKKKKKRSTEKIKWGRPGSEPGEVKYQRWSGNTNGVSQLQELDVSKLKANHELTNEQQPPWNQSVKANTTAADQVKWNETWRSQILSGGFLKICFFTSITISLPTERSSTIKQHDFTFSISSFFPSTYFLLTSCHKLWERPAPPLLAPPCCVKLYSSAGSSLKVFPPIGSSITPPSWSRMA